MSAGGVHSSLGHLEACIELAVREQVPEVVLHAFTDGRDTLPTSAPGYVAQAETWLADASRRGVPARVASVMGRYWGMDRDSRWDRTKRAYDAIVHGEGLTAESAQDAIRQAYGRDETDEFIQPTIVGDPRPLADGDSVITFNFRPDRMRQIVRALGEPGFIEFDRRRFPVVHLTTMTRYQEDWDYPVAFPEARPEITLAKVLADRGDRQLHVAETEKYAHVTYFFNGGEEHPYPGEERCARALAPRRRHLRPEAGDERGARGRRVRGPVARGGGGGPAVSLRRSSTSRTRTWSATRAASRRRSGRSRRPTAAWVRC